MTTLTTLTILAMLGRTRVKRHAFPGDRLDPHRPEIRPVHRSLRPLRTWESESAAEGADEAEGAGEPGTLELGGDPVAMEVVLVDQA